MLHKEEELVSILHTCKRNWYQFFKPPPPPHPPPPKKIKSHRCNEYLPILHTSEIINEFSTRVRNWNQFFTCVRNRYQFFTPEKKVAPVLHGCDEYLPILHTSEIINTGNLSTNFRPQNLSKLTIRKFHIWKM